jgi:flagellar hook-associated protein 1
MTSITASMLAGLTGLRAAQAGLNTASQNIANANTPGYVRTELTLTPNSQSGAGAGVQVSTIRRAADQFLATASYIAQAAQSGSAARADLLSRAQASFGDPTSSTSMFASLDQFWAAASELSLDPTSALRQGDAISALQSTFSELGRVAATVQGLIAEADQRIDEAVSTAQDLVNRISDLNQEIRLNKRSSSDVTGAENAQSALIDELSMLMDIRVTPQLDGGVHVRTSGGALLVGIEAGQLDYTASAAPYTPHGVITLNGQLGAPSNIEPFLLSGEIKGLLDARDRDLASLAQALGGFSAAVGDALNEVHNENTPSPAASQLLGRQTGLLGTDALNFTGQSIIAITDSAGILRQRLTVDFDAGTIVGQSPAATYPIAVNTIAGFASALNTALAAATPAGSASFAGGQLSMSVGASGGVIVQQDPADPSDRAGRGFAHFFGLNDIVSRPTPMFFESGAQGGDLHGLAAGGEVTYRIRDVAGRFVGMRTITIAGALAGPASTWNDLLGALNAPTTGVGGYGAFALDSATGKVSFVPTAAGYQVDLIGDTTQRGATGVSFTALNGLSLASTAGRAQEVNVHPAKAANPLLLAVGRPDVAAAIGLRIVEAADNRGAIALARAKDNVRSFAAAGVLTAQNTTLATYAARLGGEAGRMASDASRQAKGAEAIAAAAGERRAHIEGVNLDDELLRMTTFQNAYSAAARVIQAATEMLDILMTIGYR